MCQTTMRNGIFDPELCPLLQGLPPDDQAQRIRDDPRIARCTRALNVRLETAPCSGPMKRGAATEH